MAIKIKEIYGCQILYDERLRRFLIEDTDGTELGYADTQDEAEAKAKALSKQEFKRLPIVKVGHDGKVTAGQLTSLNKDDQTAWVSMDKGGEDAWGSGRQKLRLAYTTGYYEATVTNLSILERVKETGVLLKTIEAEIESLVEILEKPINLDYFGLVR